MAVFLPPLHEPEYINLYGADTLPCNKRGGLIQNYPNCLLPFQNQHQFPLRGNYPAWGSYSSPLVTGPLCRPPPAPAQSPALGAAILCCPDGKWRPQRGRSRLPLVPPPGASSPLVLPTPQPGVLSQGALPPASKRNGQLDPAPLYGTDGQAAGSRRLHAALGAAILRL